MLVHLNVKGVLFLSYSEANQASRHMASKEGYGRTSFIVRGDLCPVTKDSKRVDDVDYSKHNNAPLLIVIFIYLFWNKNKVFFNFSKILVL